MQRGATLVEMLVVLAILLGLLALLIPAVQRSRSAARVAVCKNRLRQINFAANSSAGVRSRSPGPLVDWPFVILPWLEEQPLYDVMQSDADRSGWATQPRPPLYRCPLRPAESVDWGHYGWIVRPGARLDDGGWPFAWFQDAARIEQRAPVRPWYAGLILEIVDADAIVTAGRGPHPGGALNRVSNGEVRVLPTPPPR